MARKKDQAPFEKSGYGIRANEPVAQAMLNLIALDSARSQGREIPLVNPDFSLAELVLPFPSISERDSSLAMLNFLYENKDRDEFKRAAILAAMCSR